MKKQRQKSAKKSSRNIALASGNAQQASRAAAIRASANSTLQFPAIPALANTGAVSAAALAVGLSKPDEVSTTTNTAARQSRKAKNKAPNKNREWEWRQSDRAPNTRRAVSAVAAPDQPIAAPSLKTVLKPIGRKPSSAIMTPVLAARLSAPTRLKLPVLPVASGRVFLHLTRIRTYGRIRLAMAVSNARQAVEQSKNLSLGRTGAGLLVMPLLVVLALVVALSPERRPELTTAAVAVRAEGVAQSASASEQAITSSSVSPMLNRFDLRSAALIAMPHASPSAFPPVSQMPATPKPISLNPALAVSPSSAYVCPPAPRDTMQLPTDNPVVAPDARPSERLTPEILTPPGPDDSVVIAKQPSPLPSPLAPLPSDPETQICRIAPDVLAQRDKQKPLTPLKPDLALANEPLRFGEVLAQAAIAQSRHLVVYNSNYMTIAYPRGDVPAQFGVCTDVIIRAYRAMDIDLQQLVHESRPGRSDPNIDHRRTDMLRHFFAAQGESLPVTPYSEDYLPGDIVTYYRPQNKSSTSHIAMVTAEIGVSGMPKIVHNRGWGVQLEDALFVDQMTGHYRYRGPGHTLQAQLPAAKQTPPTAVVQSAGAFVAKPKALQSAANRGRRVTRPIAHHPSSVTHAAPGRMTHMSVIDSQIETRSLAMAANSRN